MSELSCVQASLTGKLLEIIKLDPSLNEKEAAALHLLDWLGCALAGADTVLGRAMARASATVGHPLAPSGRSTPEYAFALGSFGSLLEMDDVHRTAILHPGPVIWPAVVATVTLENATRALEAALRGYEAMVRLGKSVGPLHYAHFHNTATCGGLGSAVAAAWMLGLDKDRTQWAMAHALSTSGGLWECRNEPGATKHLHVAEAARRGVQAALAAEAGIAGPLRILEGAQGFYAGLAPGGNPDALLQSEPCALLSTSFKPWPACRHTHAAIDAALALADDVVGTPKKIVIETYADAVLFCDQVAPTDPAAARFSLQHSVALALVDGPPTLSGFETAALDLPKYAKIRQICKVVENPSMTSAYPAHFGARVSVETQSNETVIHIPDAWGDTENPMPAEAIIAKFHMLAKAADIEPVPLQSAALDTQNGAFALRTMLASLPAPLTKEE